MSRHLAPAKKAPKRGTNTTKKGNRLEARVLDLLKGEIAQNRFFVTADRCKIFHKKGYYSRERQKKIVFDISIEVFQPGEVAYSLLILVECKNYNHPVPVKDVEVLHTQMQQVSGANVKGILVATHKFQEGTFNFSRSKGIALMRYYNSTKFKWILNRSPSTLVSSTFAAKEQQIAYAGITTESYQSRLFDCYCYVDDEYTVSLHRLLSRLSMSDAEKKRPVSPSRPTEDRSESRALVPYMAASKIEERCEVILDQIGYAGGEVPIDVVCQWVSKEHGLRVSRDKPRLKGQTGGEVLGMISFKPFKVVIFECARGDEARQKFTVAHELGHFLMGHSRYMLGEYCQESDFALDDPPELGIVDVMRMEWQANCFASCLLLPGRYFLADALALLIVS